MQGGLFDQLHDGMTHAYPKFLFEVNDIEGWRFCALLRRARLPTQIKRTVDQTDVTIGLRKIAQHAAGQRIKLFGKQTHIIAAREQTVE